MEEGANSFFGGPEQPQTVAIVSIAISLKRIADSLSYQPIGENIFDFARQIARSAEEGLNRR